MFASSQSAEALTWEIPIKEIEENLYFIVWLFLRKSLPKKARANQKLFGHKCEMNIYNLIKIVCS